MNDASHLTLLAADDQHHAPGLVWAYHAAPGQNPAPLAPREINAALAARDGWVWLHVDLVDRRAHSWISHACVLPESAHAILEGHEDSMALVHEDGVVHGIAADLHGEIARLSTTIGRLHFAVTDRLLVTGRRHTLAAVEEVHVTVNDRARLLQEEVAAELADESNRSLKALAVMSALLLPGSLIVGIFGMNTAGLPLTQTSGGFELALMVAAAATGLFYWLLLRAGANLRF